MNKRILWLTLILAVAIATTGCFKKSSTEEANAPAEENVAVSQDNSSVAGSLSDIFSLGKDLRCRYQTEEEGAKITGEIFVSGQKLYQEVTFPDGGKFYTISDGDWVYSWNTRISGGTKFKLEKKEGAKPGEGVDGADQQYDYDCSAWTVDAGKFAPPSDITFRDDTALIKNSQNAASGQVQDPCSACNLIPDATQQSACKTNFKCQ